MEECFLLEWKGNRYLVFTESLQEDPIKEFRKHYGEGGGEVVILDHVSTSFRVVRLP